MILFLPHEILHHVVGNDDESAAPWRLPEESFFDNQGLAKLMSQWADSPEVDLGGTPLTQLCALGMHCDGVQYSLTNRAGSTRSVLAASFNVISGDTDARRGKRHLLFVLNKQKLCNCGCGGVHTLDPIWDVLAWSLRACLRGVAPAARHDGSPFEGSELADRLAANTPVPKACLVQVRGDWEWLCVCFRFRMWSQNEFCWMCNAAKARVAFVWGSTRDSESCETIGGDRVPPTTGAQVLSGQPP